MVKDPGSKSAYVRGISLFWAGRPRFNTRYGRLGASSRDGPRTNNADRIGEWPERQGPDQGRATPVTAAPALIRIVAAVIRLYPGSKIS
jgi:hypothetical protein